MPRNIFELQNGAITSGGSIVKCLKHNDDGTESEVALTGNEFRTMIKDAQVIGMDQAMLKHGIDNVEYIHEPEDGIWDGTLPYLTPIEPWANYVYNNVRKQPYSNVKTMYVGDLTVEDARARGYLKGEQKVGNVIALLKRSTSPTTIYHYQEMDRDDLIDIDSMDVVAFLKGEMDAKLVEELSRAVLISDGRSSVSDDKIPEDRIRPIYKDVSPYTVAVENVYPVDAKRDEKTVIFMDSIVEAMAEYKGSGIPALFCGQRILSNMKLLKDGIGHPLFRSEDDICQYLGVSDIVPVPYMNDVEDDGEFLDAIVVNLQDYTLGSRKLGQKTFFEGFKMEFNKNQYLIETRCSGALARPKSALVVTHTIGTEEDIVEEGGDDEGGEGGET